MNRTSHWIARLSVEKPVTMTMLFAAIVAVGALAWSRLPVQLLPSGYTPPFIFVNIPWRDATPREVERRITRPAEEALATVRGIETLNSRSGANGTRLWIAFRDGTDMDQAYAEVRDRLDRARPEFPEDTEDYFVFKWNPNSEPIMEVAISYPEEEEDLSRLEKKLRRELERLPGVAKLEFEGMVDESVRIEIDRDRARAHGVNLYTLVQRLRREDFSMAAGVIEEGGKEHHLRSVAVLEGARDVAALPVAPGVLLGDIADVHPALSLRDVISRIDGKPSITMEIFRESEANTVETCAAVRRILERELPGDPDMAGVKFLVMHDSGFLITDSLSTLTDSAWQGGLLSLLIVWIFLLRLRLSLIINVAVPVSFLVTLAWMYFAGESLNLLTLMGLTLAVGMLVDNSVVVSENISRLRALGVPPREAAIQGASEVALPVTLATLTSVVVFLPLALMSGDGMMQFFLGRLALPVCVSLIASLFVSLALIPAATVFLAGNRTPAPLAPIRWAGSATAASLAWCLRHRFETSLLGLAAFFSYLYPMEKLDVSMEPKEAKNDVQVYFRFDSVGSLAEVNRNMKTLEAAVEKHRKELQIVNLRTRFRESWGRMTLYLEKVERTDEQRKKLGERVREILPVLAGVEVQTGWRGGGEGGGGEVFFQLVGDDSDQLADVSDAVRRRLKTLDGVSDVTTELESGNDEIRIRVRRDRAARAGIDSWVASGTVSTALRGTRLPDLRVGGQEVPLILQFPEDERENLGQLSSVALYPPGAAAPVPLSAVADFEFAKGLAAIQRENRKTSLAIRVVADTDDIEGLSERVRASMTSFSLPEGVSWDMGNWSRRWRDEQGDYGFSMTMSLVFVFLLMGILFESWILPFSVLVSVPCAFSGVCWFLWATDTTFDMMGMIGMVVLVGVVVNNAIVLIDRVQQLRNEGVERARACVEACRDRFTPIWITALTTIVGLIPMAFGDAGIAGVPYAPLARTVMSGLFVSTILTLVLVPVAYTVFDDLRAGTGRFMSKLLPKSWGKRSTVLGEAGGDSRA